MVPSRICLVPILALSLGLCPLSVASLEQSMELGRDQQWAEFSHLDGIVTEPGRWGARDLVLAQGGYQPDADTELLYHFDHANQGDAVAAYRYEKAAPTIYAAGSAVGAGGAGFQNRGDGVGLVAAAGGMFAAGAVWQDFTIELWVYPSLAADGETVLSWGGGTRTGDGIATQSLRAYFKDRRLVWEARDLFALPDGTKASYTLVGLRSVLPRAWHHHLLRFDAREGLLEYALDGVVEAIAHTTDTGRESGSIALPMVGKEHAGPLSVGPSFTGFIDELRVSRSFVAAPDLARYADRTGTAVSNVIDFGYAGTRINGIDAVFDAPGDSSVELYYRVANGYFRAGAEGALGDAAAPLWVPLRPGADLGGRVSGRFLQLMVLLYPDGTRSRSPRLSSIVIRYEPGLPPEPPPAVTATPGNGTVTLSWRRVNDVTVKGYEVYYGDARLSYFGTAAREGVSPIDVGDVTSLTLTGLENGRLYYFAVAAYDGAEPRQRSRFSAEVSARPTRVQP